MDRPMRVEIGWELTNQRPGNGQVDGPSDPELAAECGAGLITRRLENEPS